MITKEQARALGSRDELHYSNPGDPLCKTILGPRSGRVEKREVWRVNGACKTWKRAPERFSVPIKYGFRGPYAYVDEGNCHLFHVAGECEPIVIDNRKAS